MLLAAFAEERADDRRHAIRVGDQRGWMVRHPRLDRDRTDLAGQPDRARPRRTGSVLRLRSISASFSLGDAFTLTALFLEGPEFGALAVALETSAISFRLGGAPRRVMFNSAATTRLG